MIPFPPSWRLTQNLMDPTVEQSGRACASQRQTNYFQSSVIFASVIFDL
jgi:hypothetical protein